MLARWMVVAVAALPLLQSTARDDTPSIAHNAIDTLVKGQDLVVEATVTGTRPIARVSVAYQVGERFGDAALTRSGAVWRARVPGVRFDRNFSYIIHANDETGRSATWPEKTRRVVATLTDELGRAVQSEKMVEAIYEGGRLVRVGDQFGIGRRR